MINLYGNGLIGRVNVDSTGYHKFYYLKDHLGNIRQTWNSNNVIVAAQDYYSFGDILRSYNAGTTFEIYKFTGKERDAESNLDYFGARYYESGIGRWLSVDPSSSKYANLSPYVYSLNNPLKYVDPNGNDPTGVSEATVVVVGGLAILTALTIHTVEYATNSEYRSSYDSYTSSTAHLVSNSVKEIGSFIGKLFSSGESKTNVEESGAGGKESVKEQAAKISNEIGKNSVTLPDGTRVDLKGRGHRNKQGQILDTPHTHEAEQNTDSETGKTYPKTKRIPRPTTQEDLDRIKKINNQ